MSISGHHSLELPRITSVRALQSQTGDEAAALSDGHEPGKPSSHAKSMGHGKQNCRSEGDVICLTASHKTGNPLPRLEALVRDYPIIMLSRRTSRSSTRERDVRLASCPAKPAPVSAAAACCGDCRLVMFFTDYDSPTSRNAACPKV